MSKYNQNNKEDNERHSFKEVTDTDTTYPARRVVIYGADGTPINSLNVGDEIDALPVVSMEKTFPPFIGFFRHVDVPTGYTTVTVAVSKDDLTITVDDGGQITEGHVLALYTETGSAFYSGEILDVTGDVVTLDTPINADFPIGASVSSGDSDLAVDGSVTPVIYKVRQPDLPVLATGVEIVIHRVIFQCYTDTPVDDFAQFGDITALTKGLFLRYQNGSASNIFNVKSNGDFSNLAYDFDVFDTTKQNVNGFSCRLTFGGNSKIGTSLLLKDGESLEMWIQDNLTGIIRLRVLAEGYIRAVGN